MSNEVTKARNKFLRSTLTAIKASVRNAVLAMNNHEERISILKQQLDDYGITLDDFETWVRLTTGEQLDLFGGGEAELDVSRIMGGKALKDIDTLTLQKELNRRGMSMYLSGPALPKLHLAATEELLDELKERDMARVTARLNFKPDIPVDGPLTLTVNGEPFEFGEPEEFSPLPGTERAMADDNDEEEQDDERADSEPESVVADFADGDVNDADLEQRAGVYEYFEADGG